MVRSILLLLLNILTAATYVRAENNNVSTPIFFSGKSISFSNNSFAPATPVFNNGTPTVCTGNTGVAYSVTNDPAVTYSWSYSGTGVQIIGTTNSVTLNFANNATSGTLSVIATENGIQSAPATYNITVNASPTAPQFSSGFTTVCAGSATVNYSVVNDATVTYSWSYSNPAGVSITGGTTDKVTVFYGATAVSGNLIVTATKNNCSIQSILPITVNAKPATPTFTASQTNICAGTTGKVYTVTNDPTLTYSWSYSGTGATINPISGSNSTTVDFSSSATSGTLTVTAAKSGCSSSAGVSVTVSTPPAQPTISAGSPNICTGASAVPYSVTAVSGATFAWNYTGTGAVINNPTSSAITVDYANNATPGNLSVTVSNACGTNSAAIPIVFNGAAPAQPVFVTSTASVCAGSNGVAYSVTNDATVTYSWNYSGAGATINNGTTNSITVNYSSSATPGNLTVTAVKNGCTSSTSLAVTIASLPTPSFVSAPASVCAGSSGVAYSIATDPSLTYAWSYSGTGASINNPSANNISINYSNSATSGNLTVVTSKNGCSASTSVAVQVKPLPASPSQFSTFTNVVCQGVSGVQYSVTAAPSTTYNWSYSGTGATFNSTSNTVSIAFGNAATSGTLSVKSVLNGCESSALTAPITVVPITLPIVPDFSFATVCAGSPVTFTNTTPSSTAANANFTWDFGNGQNSTAVNGTTTFNNQGSFSVKLTATITACPSVTGSVTKTVLVGTPTTGVTYDTVTAVRGVAVMLSARNIGSNYSWAPATGLSASNIPNPTLIPSQTQRFLITISGQSGCSVVDTLLVRVASKTGIYIPTMFSPNGDGRNDLLAPLTVAITKLNFFRVYNRWGNLVYEQRGVLGPGIGWNGKYKGADQPAGVYIWVAEGVDIDNKVVRVDGNTVLIR